MDGANAVRLWRLTFNCVVEGNTTLTPPCSLSYLQYSSFVRKHHISCGEHRQAHIRSISVIQFRSTPTRPKIFLPGHRTWSWNIQLYGDLRCDPCGERMNWWVKFTYVVDHLEVTQRQSQRYLGAAIATQLKQILQTLFEGKVAFRANVQLVRCCGNTGIECTCLRICSAYEQAYKGSVVKIVFTINVAWNWLQAEIIVIWLVSASICNNVARIEVYIAF